MTSSSENAQPPAAIPAAPATDAPITTAPTPTDTASEASTVSASASKPPRECDISREIRIAIVMYGGVSLAIYMNGIRQELLHLVRATAPDSPLTEYCRAGNVTFRPPER